MEVLEADPGLSFGEVGRRSADVTLSAGRRDDQPPIACAVRSADCGTILIGDRASGAVCAIHAGWKGTTLGVVEAGVRALRARVGGEGDLVAAVGPHIEIGRAHV